MMAEKNIGVGLAARPGASGTPTLDHFSVFETKKEEKDDLQEGQILCKTLFLSVDPYMRCRMNDDTGVDYIKPWPIGAPAAGGGVGTVISSKHPNWKEGDIVESFAWEWKQYVVLDANSSQLHPVPKDIPPQWSLGVLGMTGLTSYMGMIEVVGDSRKQHSHTTLVVSGAAGACGVVAGQIGKIMGYRVVGICGTQEKMDYLTQELNFDGAINYKEGLEKVKERLGELCPQGVDLYFDNVGVGLSDTVIMNMNENGQILLCGQIAVYNKDVPYPPPLGEQAEQHREKNNIQRTRFVVLNYIDVFPTALGRLAGWMKEGKIKWRETVTEGIEGMGGAFVGMMNGGNIGKAIVKV